MICTGCSIILASLPIIRQSGDTPGYIHRYKRDISGTGFPAALGLADAAEYVSRLRQRAGEQELRSLIEAQHQIALKVLFALCEVLAQRLRETNERYMSIFTIAQWGGANPSGPLPVP